MNTNTTELAQLRAELSNPAIGSKDHLRKLALSLVEALEKAQGMEAYWKTQCRGITDHCVELQARNTELESKLAKPVLLPKTNGYWTETEKAYEEAITLAKRKIRLAGFRCEGDE